MIEVGRVVLIWQCRFSDAFANTLFMAQLFRNFTFPSSQVPIFGRPLKEPPNGA